MPRNLHHACQSIGCSTTMATSYFINTASLSIARASHPILLYQPVLRKAIRRFAFLYSISSCPHWLYRFWLLPLRHQYSSFLCTLERRHGLLQIYFLDRVCLCCFLLSFLFNLHVAIPRAWRFCFACPSGRRRCLRSSDHNQMSGYYASCLGVVHFWSCYTYKSSQGSGLSCVRTSDSSAPVRTVIPRC